MWYAYSRLHNNKKEGNIFLEVKLKVIEQKFIVWEINGRIINMEKNRLEDKSVNA